jgi:hypothetical protein
MRGQSVEHHRSTRVLAVASGRGGVDKPNILASSAFALAKLRKNMLAMKTDPSLGQLDIMPAFIPLTSCSWGLRACGRSSWLYIRNQWPSQPFVRTNHHRYLCIAIDNLAKRPDSISLAADAS